MKDWNAVDWIVALLTGSVVFFLCTVIFTVAIEGRVLSDKRAALLAQIVTSLITIISIYVGGKIRHKDDQ